MLWLLRNLHPKINYEKFSFFEFSSEINYEKFSFSRFYLNISLIPIYNYIVLLSSNSPGFDVL